MSELFHLLDKDSKILEFVKTASSALNVKLYQTKASEMTFDIDRIEIEI